MPVSREQVRQALKSVARKTSAGIGGTMAAGIAGAPVQMALASSLFKRPYEDWQSAKSDLSEEMGTEDVPIFTSSKLKNNAFYAPHGINDPLVKHFDVGLLDRILKDPRSKHGIIMMGKNAPAAALAHEMGHARQQMDRGPWGKKYAHGLMNLSNMLSLFGAIGGAVLGKSVPGRLGKVLLKRPGALRRIGQALSSGAASKIGLGVGGVGTGYAMNLPRLNEEWGATSKALKAIEQLRTKKELEDAKKRLTRAYRTYQIGALMPAVGGTIGGAL